MKKLFVIFISLLLVGGLQAQTEEELDALMEEMDEDTPSYTGEGDVYNSVDLQPKPTTSMTDFYGKVNNYIKENYPEGASSYGRVYVDFVVEIDGSLTNFSVSQGLNEKINQVAMDAVKSYGKWIPGKNGLVTVRAFFSQPIMIKEDLIK